MTRPTPLPPTGPYPVRRIMATDGTVIASTSPPSEPAPVAVAKRETQLPDAEPFRVHGALSPDVDQDTPAVTQTPPARRLENP
jgi:hypothetical protein